MKPGIQGREDIHDITNLLSAFGGGMADRLSESDLSRIAEFANTPRYERSPEQLLPEGEREEEDVPTAEGERA